MCVLLSELNCSLTLIFVIIAYVTSARPEKIELNNFLNQLQNENHVFYKKVFVDDKEMSLADFFKVSNAGRLKIDDSWPITEHNVSNVSHLLNMVVSCEYNDAIYNFVKIVFKRLNECKSKYLNKQLNDRDTTATCDCLKALRTDLFEPMLKTMSSMILTLAGLLIYTKNFVSKKHDVLKILLSWYTFIDKGTEYDSNKYSSLDTLNNYMNTIESINYQVQSYSELFSITNCYQISNYEIFKQTVDGFVSKSSAASKFDTPTATCKSATATMVDVNEYSDTLLKIKIDKLQRIVYYSFERLNKMHLFVFCSDDGYFRKLLCLIDNESIKEHAEMKWGNNRAMPIKNVYENFITKSTDIKTICLFEKLILEKITRIIVSYAAKNIHEIMENTEDPDTKRNSCNRGILLILEKYIKVFKNLGQPSFLINNMIILNDLLWKTCYNMQFLNTENDEKKKAIENNINVYDIMKLDDFQNSGNRSLEDFLFALSNTVICTNLHPAVSKIFMEKMYFMPSIISEYVTDYRELSTPDVAYNSANVVLCNKIRKLLKILNSMDAIIVKCQNKAREQNLKKNCFRKFKGNCVQLEKEIVDLIINKMYKCNTVEWKRILLMVKYNLYYVDLFFKKVQNSFNVERMENLRKFTYNVMYLVEARYSTHCHRTPNPKDEKGIKGVTLVFNNFFHKNCIKSWAKETKLVAIDIYIQFFKLFSLYVQSLVDDCRTEDQLKIYWDGTEQTLHQVHSNFKDNIFDAQDAYDHLTFISKWMVGILYTGFLDIINEIIFFKYQLVDQDKDILNYILDIFDFSKIPLFINRSVFTNVLRYKTILENFDGTHVKDLLNYRDNIQDTLELSGVVPSSVANLKGSISDRLTLLYSKILVYSVIYHKFKIDFCETIKSMGMDDYNIMLIDDD